MSEDFRLSYKINTWIKGNNEICQEIETPYGDRILRQVLRLSEKEIRDKLIEMGWTPPVDESPESPPKGNLETA